MSEKGITKVRKVSHKCGQLKPRTQGNLKVAPNPEKSRKCLREEARVIVSMNTSSENQF
jgi:hypothetical protein